MSHKERIASLHEALRVEFPTLQSEAVGDGVIRFAMGQGENRCVNTVPIEMLETHTSDRLVAYVVAAAARMGVKSKSQLDREEALLFDNLSD